MKINNFRGDLADISAEKEALSFKSDERIETAKHALHDCDYTKQKPRDRKERERKRQVTTLDAGKGLHTALATYCIAQCFFFSRNIG